VKSGSCWFRLDYGPRSPVSEFRGYTDDAATDKKIVRDVFSKGDRYYRSGDLMRYDEDDFFYFVDRIGDTYRWKGENVSTAEVADVLARAPGICQNDRVRRSGSGDGRPGRPGSRGLRARRVRRRDFWRVAQELPSYAQPRFVRVIDQLSTTATFKIQKATLRKEGIDPVAQAGRLYVRRDHGYAPLTPQLWTDIVDGAGRI